MSEHRSKPNRNVDDAGIRLAPTPVQNASYHVMPAVRQEFVIEPHMVLDDPEAGDKTRQTESTANDFQPKKQDISKKWKRRRRSKNMIVGAIMLAVSLVVILPYILGATGVMLDSLPFRYVPVRYNVLHNIIEAFKITAQNGWKGPVVNQVWINEVPDLMLAVGIVCLLLNVVKSLIGLFGGIKYKRYTVMALIYFISILCVLIMSLVGAPAIGVEKIDFVQSVIRGYKTSDLFGMLVISLGYFLVSAVCSAVCAEKYGYLK